MSRNFTPDDLFKKQLGEMPFEPSDATWQKIESALAADKAPEKDKRRWAIILLLVLVTGGGVWFALQTGNGKKSTLINKADNPSKNTDQKKEIQKNFDTGKTTENKDQKTNSDDAVTSQTPIRQPAVTNQSFTTNNTTGIHPNSHSKTVKPQAQLNTKAAGIGKSKPAGSTKENNTGNEAMTTAPRADIPALKNTQQDIAMKIPDSKLPVVSNQEEKEPKPGHTEPAPSAPEVKSPAGTSPFSNSMAVYAQGGAAIASPFNKTGYYGGILLTKTTKDKKHLYAGISVVSHKLEHQFISADKMSSPGQPLTTDAVVDRMTSIRLSAGYLFPLDAKKQEPSGFLSVGFEPSYAIRLRTLFYEQPGQPAIVNSPVMDKAVNRFNLYFTTGFQKTFKPGIGISLKAGYGLIPVTNKEFYNRTLKNNNIKSLEVGLQYRISKK